MLKISRKENESFVIQVGNDIITIAVSDISDNGKQAHIAIDAPKEYKVWRTELYDAIKENEEAVKAKVNPAVLKNFFNT